MKLTERVPVSESLETAFWAAYRIIILALPEPILFFQVMNSSAKVNEHFYLAAAAFCTFSATLPVYFDFDFPPWDCWEWAPIRFQRDAENIKQLMQSRASNPRLAALCNGYGGESHLEVYPPLMTGPFLFREADG